MNLLDESIWAGRLATLSASAPSEETFRIGACVVNGQTGRIEAPGRTARLRRKELELLAYLYRCAAPVDRQQLLREVWQCTNVITRTVDQTVATLRRKLNEDSANPKHLVTVYGIGYQLRKDLAT
jgi:two-component system, OmpR family, response regulator RegX3